MNKVKKQLKTEFELHTKLYSIVVLIVMFTKRCAIERVTSYYRIRTNATQKLNDLHVAEHRFLKNQN